MIYKFLCNIFMFFNILYKYRITDLLEWWFVLFTFMKGGDNMESFLINVFAGVVAAAIWAAISTYIKK